MRARYKIEIAEGWKWPSTQEYIFFTRVRFAREGKAVALQYHKQGSTDTNVCGGFAVVRALSVDEHEHSPARIR